MINPVEYNLDGNEFKVLQFLKSNTNLKIKAEKFSELVGMHRKTLRRVISNLEHYQVLTVTRDGTEQGKFGIEANEYKLNEQEKWRLQ